MSGLDLAPFETHESWERRLRVAFKRILPLAFFDPSESLPRVVDVLRVKGESTGSEEIMEEMIAAGARSTGGSVRARMTSPSKDDVFLVDVMHDLWTDEEAGGCGYEQADFLALVEELSAEMAREAVAS